MKTLSVAFLIVIFSTRVYVQDVSVSEDNRITEVFNECKCVPLDQCNDIESSTVGDSGVINRRTNAPRILCKGGSIGNEIVCCKQVKAASTEKPTEKTFLVPIDPSTNSSPCGSSKTTVKERTQQHNTDADDIAIDGEFPWLVAVFKKNLAGTFDFQCGGSLIHAKVVLTAYHCIYKKKPSDVLVRANGKVEVPTAESDTRSVSEIVKHPRYFRHPRLYYDAALLFLDTPFAIGNTLNTLCLPPPNSAVNLDGCFVAGWREDLQGRRSTKLKKVPATFVSPTKCQELMRNTALGKDFNLHQSFMCAGGEEGKNVCIGDGGSPLMCEIPSEEERYFQAGIVSWGLECNQKDIPLVYTDVNKVNEWIRDQLSQKNLSI